MIIAYAVLVGSPKYWFHALGPSAIAMVVTVSLVVLLDLAYPFSGVLAADQGYVSLSATTGNYDTKDVLRAGDGSVIGGKQVTFSGFSLGAGTSGDKSIDYSFTPTTLTGLIGSILVQTQYYMLDKATMRLFALATNLTEVFVVSVLERGQDGHVR